ncbi:MAG: quinone-dependent dihydroorotate dehydrogenase [Anaerolineae bacterium]|nr:quinone-dependent dihydroorotate dehydrogenase [Anaerolineae bacterium]
MYSLFRSLLFRLDPETSHQFTVQLLRIGGVGPIHSILQTIYAVPSKPVQSFGLTFKNPIGLAAGYDKNAIAIKGLSALGFGHIEVGTVTPKPQPGNPRPRVFRLLEDEAVINRMGFPSKGMQYVSDQLSVGSKQLSVSSDQLPVVLGVNLGKNKETPVENAAEDYVSLMKTFAPLADYLTINISSPNTVGLRRLQGREMLEQLLGAIHEARQRRDFSLTPSPPSASLRDASQSPSGRWGFVPILVKIAPDLTDEELEDAIGVILDKNMDGIIATNTTLAREGLRSRHQSESGGLSGSPLRVRSEAVLRQVIKLVNGKVPIISVGGIMNPDGAKRRLEMGATLIQLYTGLVYEGPGLVKKILK